MLRFIGRRVVFIALVSVLIVFFSHLGMRMIRNSSIAEPNYDVVEHGKLAWSETRTFFNQVMKGDLGSVIVNQQPIEIKDLIAQSYLNSMGLMVTALIAAALLGMLIGVIAAITRWRHLVLPLLTLTILGISTPSFFIALLLQVGEIYYYRTFGRRLVLLAGFGWDFRHMLMPVLVLAARPLAYLTRASFISLGRIMEEDYIRTAFSKGLGLLRTVNVHALRNALVPVLTAIGVSIRFSLGILPIVELFFIWPGMGLNLLNGINNRQTTLVAALAFALGLTILLINFLLDILYRIIDPRMREGQWTS